MYFNVSAATLTSFTDINMRPTITLTSNVPSNGCLLLNCKWYTQNPINSSLNNVVIGSAFAISTLYNGESFRPYLHLKTLTSHSTVSYMVWECVII